MANETFTHLRTNPGVVQNGSSGFTFRTTTAGGGAGTQQVKVTTGDYDMRQANDAGVGRPYGNIAGSFGDRLNLASAGGGTQGKGGVAKVTYDFQNLAGQPDPVTGVSFTIANIASGSAHDSPNRPVIRIVAYDPDGNIIPDNKIESSLGSNVQRSDNGTNYLQSNGYKTYDGKYDTRDGVSFSSKGGYGYTNTDPRGTATITVKGNVARIEIFYSQEAAPGYAGSVGQQSVFIGPMTFNPNDVCFARGTLIMTDRGEVAVEDLRVGDLVATRDNGMQPIRWIGGSAIRFLDSASHLAPIRIAAGALGNGIPTADLLVSPQHRVLVRSNIAQKMFSAPEVLVAAKQLCQIDGIDIATDLTEVEYFHILFDQHEIVLANGAETESLFTGPMALAGVGAAAREEILEIFPELRDRDYTPEPARMLASGRMGRKLAVRHSQNRKPLVM
ncbi:MAG: Hint domain-containing protein [Paracoccus sp. (in: a-proteobacteria)]|nr:Hint domain-containing protein [Paracoccus sp. (in: a-proteobacteria)]